MQDYRQSQKDLDKSRREAFRKWKEEQARIGEENRKNGVVTKPMVSYVNVHSDKVTEEDLPVNSSYRTRPGIVPLSHSSRPVQETEDNLYLYGANVNGGEEQATNASTGGTPNSHNGRSGGASKPPPALPEPELAMGESEATAAATTGSGEVDWNPEVDAMLAKLVRKNAFDFEAVAVNLQKKLAKKAPGADTAFVSAESCRLRWCGLDYLRYKKTAVESPTSKTKQEGGEANKSKAEANPSPRKDAPPLPAAIAAALGETDLDELD